MKKQQTFKNHFYGAIGNDSAEEFGLAGLAHWKCSKGLCKTVRPMPCRGWSKEGYFEDGPGWVTQLNQAHTADIQKQTVLSNWSSRISTLEIKEGALQNNEVN